jgi:hypothetical protein
VTSPEQIAKGLTQLQRQGLLTAYQLSGPSGDTYITDQDAFDALYYHEEADLLTPGGRLTELGLEVRKLLEVEP